jgi:hypothetical protein
MPLSMKFFTKFAAACVFALIAASALVSRQNVTPPKPSPPAADAPKTATTTADFIRTTDEVLADMSKLLGMPIKEPLKKSLRSRDEIRAYVLREMNEDETAEERYADQKEMEKLGLIPKGFPLDSFMVDLLTEQIAGLYDSKDKEFFIADWIAADDQKEVMAHELTHALQDQYYHLDKWRDAAKPNEDAELARDAVLEGSAVASMLDYGLHQQGMALSNLGELNLSTMLGQLDDASAPLLAKAPQFIRDDLTFPYGAGADFAQHILLARGGWSGLHTVFENPPVSSQQILHPDLYLRGVTPQKVDLPDLSRKLGKNWKMLDANVIGEFGLLEVLKQFLDEKRAKDLARVWDGDRYAVYQQTDTKQVLLALRIHADTDEDAARLSAGLSEALAKKYDKRTHEFRRPNYLTFDTPDDGPVFLRCVASDCVSLEGAGKSVFDELIHTIGWTANPIQIQ